MGCTRPRVDTNVVVMMYVVDSYIVTDGASLVVQWLGICLYWTSLVVPVVTNLPAYAADKGLIPDPGRSPLPRGN